MDNTQVTAYQPQSTGLSVFSDANIMKSAELLANSDIIPQAFRGKPANVLIAMDMSQRLGNSPMLVMQNIDVIQGKPSWSSKFLIALINSCGRYTSLKYKFGNDPNLGGMTCYAYATEKATGEEIVGPTISMKMAQDEGWLTKNGSKWKTMPEVMIRYRAASFFARLNCPEVLFGMYTTDEQYEISGGDTNSVSSPDGSDYLDLTSQEPAPASAPAEPEQPRQPSPKMRLWNAVLEQVGGNEAKAAEICKAVVGGQTVTEDNLGRMIVEASKIGVVDDITESASKSETEPEEVPEHLREEPF